LAICAAKSAIWCIAPAKITTPLPHRPGEEGPAVRQPYAPLPPLSRDGLLDPEYIKAFSERLDAKRAFEEQERANAVYDDGLLDANNWPPHLRARLLGDAPVNDDTNRNFSGNDRLQLADAPEATDENDATPVQIAQAPDTEDGQLAQASDAPPERNRAAAVPDLDDLVRQAQSSKRWFGESKECVGLVKKAANLGHTSTWRAGDAIKTTDDPPLKPGTAIATFRPDKNGDIRYPQDRDKPGEPRTRRHAGIFLNYDTYNGRAGFWALDQFNGRDGDPGNAKKRFYPFERKPGERGYAGAEFSAIQSPAR